MTSFLLPTAIAIGSAVASLMAMSATVAREELLRPATVNPFSPSVGDPSADTLSSADAMAQTVFAPAHDWQVATLDSLHDVEDLLDSLEAHGVETREVLALTDRCFAVRWK
jgi:hypothetical protein